MAVTTARNWDGKMSKQDRTAKGSAVVHMWACPMPQPGGVGAGYPILKHAEHTCVYQATRETGAYNHHSQIVRHAGHFHAMWSNHPHGEDGPGQRVLYGTSSDGKTWSRFQELFPPPGPVIPSEEMGLTCTAFRWLVLDNTLYAVAGLHRNVGFVDHNGELPPVPRKDEQHRSRARDGHAPLARSVYPDGTFGPIFATGSKCAQDLAFATAPDPTNGRLREINSRPSHLPSWDFEGIFKFPRAAENGHRLCEPTVYRNCRGRWVMLLRDLAYSHRMYVSHLDEDTGVWQDARPTDIPDSPGLSCTVQLEDGTVLLVGNQMAPVFDNGHERRHYGRDPLTVSVSRDGKLFSRCYALRCGIQQYRVPQTEVLGRGGGGQYPSALVHEGILYVLYSMGKEDIWFCSVALQNIGSDADPNSRQGAEGDADKPRG